MQENAAKIRALEIKGQALKKEVMNIRKRQISYYQALLAEGHDCRQEGLIWIIKIIWYLGANITLTKLPRFLDEKSIEFLFKVRCG